jgi:CRISPR-associated protein Cas5h
MIMDINRILYFSIKGKFAHFRKFYTNSSSLSYSIPPRTVVMGIIASVLKIPRDQYYDEFSEKNLGISVAIPSEKPITKQMQSMNYLHDKYFDLIAKGSETGKVLHSQCKLELLTGYNHTPVEYDVYLGFNKENALLKKLEEKIIDQDYGYGIYLGQRQFRGFIDNFMVCVENDFKFFETSTKLDTICTQGNIISLNLSPEIDLHKEQMPSGFKKTKNGREGMGTHQVIFEKNGKRIAGEFKNAIQLNGKYISFY